MRLAGMRFRARGDRIEPARKRPQQRKELLGRQLLGIGLEEIDKLPVLGEIGERLLLGERNYTNDFLYQTEWQEYLAEGALSRIDVAFSRDQPEKIYVQQRLWEARNDLLKWVDDGAHIYVCGDEKGMARDVDVMLARVLAEAARGDDEAGRAKLKELAKAGRYQRDVY
jgi:sulfite reductase alpha subunit-like flavoprotein